MFQLHSKCIQLKATDKKLMDAFINCAAYHPLRRSQAPWSPCGKASASVTRRSF